MSKIIRPGFRVPPIHKPPEVEEILGKVVEMMQIQALNIEALVNCVGRERFEAGLESALKAKVGKDPGAP
jgi:hypothetical protein